MFPLLILVPQTSLKPAKVLPVRATIQPVQVQTLRVEPVAQMRHI